ncbi:MAG: hypothetical protein MUC63_03970, partial [Planctomycetes bacterium]|nr:hypothetical protein [Planctomycetota bacterium]
MAHLERAAETLGPWSSDELQGIYGTEGQILANHRRLEEYAAFMQKRLKAGTDFGWSWLYTQHLSALFQTGREAEARALVREWLAVRGKGEAGPGEVARREAAAAHALGEGFDSGGRSLVAREEEKILAETARALLFDTRQRHLARMILTRQAFLRTEEGRRARREAYQALCDGLDTLSALQIAVLFEVLHATRYQPEKGARDWKALAEGVLRRWSQTEGEEERAAFESVLRNWGPRDLVLDLGRKKLQAAPEGPARTAEARALLRDLLLEPWTPSLEEEQVSLLKLAWKTLDPSAPDFDARAAQAVLDLFAFVSRLPEARAAAALEALPNAKELSARQRRAALSEARRKARADTAALLETLAAGGAPEVLRPWLAIERITLDAYRKAPPEALREGARALFGDALELAAHAKERGGALRESVLAARALGVLMHLAAGDPAPGAADAVLAWVSEAAARGDRALEWRSAKVLLLKALDRPAELEAALEAFWGGGEAEGSARWGADFARALAERGELRKAAGVFDAMGAREQLGHEDWRELADWRHALNEPEACREAKRRSWTVLQEWEIARGVAARAASLQSGSEEAPAELDPEIPLMLAVLFEKSSYPANHAWTVQNLYARTRDARLLECLPAAVVGHTTQGVYEFLENLRSTTDAVWEEAAADAVMRRIAELDAKGPAPADRRALRLLEFVVTHRAAGQRQGARDWIESVRKALVEAGRGPWARGEPVLLAQFLAGGGPLEPESLLAEQVRILGSLLAEERPGAPPHLRVAGCLAAVLWQCGRREEALRESGGALDAARASNGGRLPAWADEEFHRRVGWLCESGEWIEGEKALEAEIRAAHGPARTGRFKIALFRLWAGALDAEGATALGSGADLYRAARDRMLGELEARTDERHAMEAVGVLAQAWLWASRSSVEGAKRDVLEFSRTRVPRLLELYQHREGEALVQIVGSALREICGPAEALEFFLDRIDGEPPWTRRANVDTWSRQTHEMARCRHEAAGLSEALQSRLLAVVLRELRADLETGSGRGRSMTTKRSDYFWVQKEHEFARTAREVLAQHAGSERAVSHIAAYLYDDLRRPGEAIDALSRLAEEGKLSVGGRRQLVAYLRGEGRFAEAVPLLEGLIASRPDEADLRALLMEAFFRLGDGGRLRKALAEADRHFHGENRWNEPVIAVLAQACLQTSLFAEAEGYFGEAIALHVRSAPNRGVGDGTLSVYYRSLAFARSGLGKTAEAVDAAAGAIVSWGPARDQRNAELACLEGILRAARDLDEYAAKLSAEVEKTGLENPIVRKALGKVFIEKSKPGPAEAHLRAAVLARANDLQARELLVKALEEQGKKAAAVAELLEAARTAGKALSWFASAGELLEKLGDAAEAERAYTSLVEASPLESEGHAALADVRMRQERPEEALAEWRRVVDIRSNEPPGFLGLARVLMALERWDEARDAALKVQQGKWHRRFGDVKSQAEEILREIEGRRRK